MIGALGDVLFRLLRGVFRVLPLSPSRRERCRRAVLERLPFLRLKLPQARLPIGTALPWRPAQGRALGYVEHRIDALPTPLPATLVAFYLPQFHRIAENDRWWGEGFTEWRNTARAQPMFVGHVQPRVPEMGEYDLNDADTLRRQVALAKQYGIGAFCSYFYWFGGKTLLEAPLKQWLAQTDIDFPLCLCWANEDWTRTWDGRGQEILIAQSHSEQDDLDFIAHIAPYLADPRYLRVDGLPLLLVYRPSLLPDAKATAARWRRWCLENGIGEIRIANVQSFEQAAPQDYGFDLAVEFPPNPATARNLTEQHIATRADFQGEILDWRDVARHYLTKPVTDYPLIPAVNCGWDNTPRRMERARVFIQAAPQRYRDWLSQTLRQRLVHQPSAQKLVFINAWNEWAEGATLEPDTRLGHAWLQATRDALCDAAETTAPPPRFAVVIHAWYADVLATILNRLRDADLACQLIVTTTHDKAAEMRAVLDQHGLQDAELSLHENRGRDILPFMRVAYRLRAESVDWVLKLHTKRSLHRADGAAWMQELLDGLLPIGRTAELIHSLRNDPSLGLLTAEGHLQPLSYFWGANRDQVQQLATRAGWSMPDPARDRFIAGSMFWCRVKALAPLLDLHLGEDEFHSEQGQVDGTLAHAIERAFSLAAAAQGLSVRTTAALLGQSEARAVPYRYADRDL